MLSSIWWILIFAAIIMMLNKLIDYKQAQKSQLSYNLGRQDGYRACEVLVHSRLRLHYNDEHHEMFKKLLR